MSHNVGVVNCGTLCHERVPIIRDYFSAMLTTFNVFIPRLTGFPHFYITLEIVIEREFRGCKRLSAVRMLVVRVVYKLTANHIPVLESCVTIALRHAQCVGHGHYTNHSLPLNRSRFHLCPHRLCPIIVDTYKSAVTPCAVTIIIVAHFGGFVRQHNILFYLPEHHVLNVREIHPDIRSGLSFQVYIFIFRCCGCCTVNRCIIQFVNIKLS